jgi:hypothetical protein
MSSYLDFEGVYDKSKRYIVNNWSPEDFTQEFGAESVYNGANVVENKPKTSITIKAGEMRELGQFEAFTITRHFVDREMLRGTESLESKARERQEMALNMKDLRKPFEEKTIQEIKLGEETAFMDKLREDIRKEEIAKLEKAKGDKKEEKNINTKEDKKKSLDSTQEFGGVV